jgi:hypothetical protein
MGPLVHKPWSITYVVRLISLICWLPDPSNNLGEILLYFSLIFFMNSNTNECAGTLVICEGHDFVFQHT